MYAYQCTACLQTFPDKQSFLQHKNVLYADDPGHEGCTYKRMTPETAPFKAKYNRTDYGYRCNLCGLKFTKKALKQIREHVKDCPGPAKGTVLDPRYDQIKALEISVGRFLTLMETQNHFPDDPHQPYAAELHKIFKVPEILQAEWRYYVSKVEVELSRDSKGHPSKREYSPMQKMAYAFHLLNWERVKMSAYDLAWECVRRDRERTIIFLRTYFRDDDLTADVIAYLEKEDQFTTEFGAQDTPDWKLEDINTN
jgi:hypothetical protein